MKIGLDIDDTLADFVGQLLKNMEELHGFAPKYKDIWHYKLQDSIPLPDAYVLRLLAQTTNQMDTLPVLEDGLYRAAVGLVEDGHDVRFITHRPRYTAEMTIDWLKSYELPLNFVHTDSRKKGEYCRERGIDLLIDDNPMEVECALKQNVGAFVFTRPWNKDYKLPRVNTVEDVLTLVQMCKVK